MLIDAPLGGRVGRTAELRWCETPCLRRCAIPASAQYNLPDPFATTCTGVPSSMRRCAPPFRPNAQVRSHARVCLHRCAFSFAGATHAQVCFLPPFQPRAFASAGALGMPCGEGPSGRPGGAIPMRRVSSSEAWGGGDSRVASPPPPPPRIGGHVHPADSRPGERLQMLARGRVAPLALVMGMYVSMGNAVRGCASHVREGPSGAARAWTWIPFLRRVAAVVAVAVGGGVGKGRLAPEPRE